MRWPAPRCSCRSHSFACPASVVCSPPSGRGLRAQEMDADRAHVERLEKRLREGIMARCDHVQLNGPANSAQRYPGNVNLSFAYVEGESLLMGLREIAVSSGSACTSSSLEPSYVLRCARSPASRV